MTKIEVMMNNTKIDPYEVREVLPKWVYYISSVFLGAVGSFGIVSNLAIVYLFLKHSMLRTPFNFLLMNVILCELTIALYGVPVDLLAALNLGWSVGPKLCVVTGLVLTTAGLVSLETLAVLSVQRYLCTSRPKHFNRLSLRTVALLIAFVWLLVLTISLPPLFGVGHYVPETSGISCAPDWERVDASNWGYVLYLLVAGFVLPAAIVIVSSGLTFLQILRQGRVPEDRTIRRRSVKRSRRVSVLVLAMAAAFLLCWTPYGVLSLLRFVYASSVVADGVAVVPLLFAKTSICWNPILYILLNPQFGGLVFRERRRRRLAARRSISGGRIRRCNKEEQGRRHVLLMSEVAKHDLEENNEDDNDNNNNNNEENEAVTTLATVEPANKRLSLSSASI